MPPSSALTVTALADSTRETDQQALKIIRRHFEAREPALQPRSPAFAAGFGMAEQHAAEPLKHCPGCGLRKPLSMFHKNKSKPDAHASNCKMCANAGVQRKRQAKRELDAAGAPQQQQQLRGRHAAGLSSAILDVAAAAHRGGSEDDGPHGGSPTDANLQQHFYGRQHSMPPQLYAGGAFGGGGQLGTRSISVGASLGGAAFGSLAASPPGQVAGTTGAFGAGGSGLHAAHALASGQTLQQALAAQQQARIAALQGFGSSGGMADGNISPFAAAAAVAAVASSSAAAGGGGATKLCRNCFMERPVLGHFEPSPQAPDGLSPNCRTCTAAADLLAWVQQEAEMAKVTLQAVRAQHGDDSPAALVAFHSAVAAHNAYIQALAAMRPQQQPDAAAAGAGPVAAAVAAMVAARQHEQDQIQALQQAQQMQKAAEWRQALQQAQLQALQAAQLQQDQSQMQQQPQWQQQPIQLQQQQLLLQPSLPSLRRPSPQRSGGIPMVGGSAQMTLSGVASVGDGTTAVTSAGAPAIAAAAEQQQQQRSANASPALQLGLRSVARGLSLSLPVSPRASQGAVPLSTSTGSVAAAAAAAAAATSGGGSAEASPAVSGAAPRAPALPQRSCFACGKPSAGGFALPMCEECQNAGPITAAAATAAASGAGDHSEKAAAGKSEGTSPSAAGVGDASGLEKLMTLGSLQNPLSSRSFSSTSSRSTAAQQLLALSGWGSDAEAGLAGRLGSGFGGAGLEGVRSDSERLRDALAGDGFSLGRLTPGGASGMLAAAAAARPDAAAQQAGGTDGLAARLATGPSLPLPPVPRLLPGSAAGADAPTERPATPATLQPGPPPSSLAAALQQAAAAAPSAAKPGGDAGAQRPTATRRVSWNMAAVQPPGGTAVGEAPGPPAADKPPADD